MVSPETSLWYAVRVKPRHEKSVERLLRDHVEERYLPLMRVRHKWTQRYQYVDLPLFPGYLFSRFSAGDKNRVLACPGVIEVVSSAHRPIPVDWQEIEQLRRVTMTTGTVFRPWAYLKAGDVVEIRRGALTGLRGILVREKGDYQLIISVCLLQRSIAVEIDRDWIEPYSDRKLPGLAAANGPTSVKQNEYDLARWTGT